MAGLINDVMTFLSNAYRAFEKQKPDRKINHLKQENTKLKQIIGDLSLELKKTKKYWIETWKLLKNYSKK